MATTYPALSHPVGPTAWRPRRREAGRDLGQQERGRAAEVKSREKVDCLWGPCRRQESDSPYQVWNGVSGQQRQRLSQQIITSQNCRKARKEGKLRTEVCQPCGEHSWDNLPLTLQRELPPSSPCHASPNPPSLLPRPQPSAKRCSTVFSAMTSGEGDGFLNGFPTEGRLGVEAGILAEKTPASARQDAIICLSLPTDLGPMSSAPLHAASGTQ